MPTVDVLMKGVLQQKQLPNGIVGGKCGSSYCQLCQAFGAAVRAPKAKKAKEPKPRKRGAENGNYDTAKGVAFVRRVS